ncbi:hypothetical protein [Sedimenticola selenatireducens]|uniref:Uncharacterized protein n=1 Tax=Sedimenticola selenatireducens TaxID=191960 RepID=A0A557RZ66_9GAMM|nr:hypothetical protein [Sedimenticola selenatireducens]TVO70452.1 hypothetical protein FHP88_16320 [Sedimenticola selenatireducens]TVT63029.1 MAG: hypothetical protein FHK78_12695 [Sedimenticola selenatireducens]
MKFSQLTPGDTFLYKGVEYTKIGPLQAIDKTTGTEKMIMRAASVELARSKTKMDEEASGKNALTSKLAVLESIMTEYHQTCLGHLDGADNEKKRVKMEEQFKKIEGALGDLKKQPL